MSIQQKNVVKKDKNVLHKPPCAGKLHKNRAENPLSASIPDPVATIPDLSAAIAEINAAIAELSAESRAQSAESQAQSQVQSSKCKVGEANQNHFAL